MTTIGAWLDAREPQPPAALRARVRELLGAELELDASEASERCLAAGEALVAGLLRGNCVDRDSALDLLAADALTTYAFEAAATDPASLGARASAAMRRIAALGTADTVVA